MKDNERRNTELGAMNTLGLLMMGIGMIFIAVGFIVFPVITTATDALLAYTFSSLSTITASTFTGFTAVVGITPLLVLIGLVTAGVVTGFLGLRMQRAGTGGKINNVGLLNLAIGVIFIAVGLLVTPVVLDGVATSMAHQASQTDIDTTVVTAVGVSTGNATLTQTPFNSDVSEVTSITSNISDTVVADNFSSSLLFVTGLTANQTQTLTVVYDYADSLAAYSGTNTVLAVVPVLVLISFLAAAVVMGFVGSRSLVT